MTSGPQTTIVGGRRVQFEMFFTLPDFSDVSLRDYQETMQRPFFSLSKERRIKPIEYVSPDKTVTVHVSANPEYGMATIWDADIMIYLASHLNEMRERGDNDLSPTIRVQPGDMLKRICWGSSTGYDTGLLASELVATEVEHFIQAIDPYARLLNIPRSKGNQEGERAAAYLSPRTVWAIAPLREAADIEAGPVFRRVNVRRYKTKAALRGRSIDSVFGREA